MPGCGASDKVEVVEIDFTRFEFPGDLTPKPQWEIILKCIIVSLLIFVAIVGNILIIVIVFSSKKMRSRTNYYIANLAVADLFVALFPMWIYIINDVTGKWILGGFLCKFNAFVQTCSMTAIAFTMMAIAGDRFFAIVFPFKARVTQSKVKVVLAFVWVCAISISIPPLVFYKYFERRWKDYTETFCTDIWPDHNCDHGVQAERAYWTVVVAVLNWLPMLMMTINYSVIIHRLSFMRVAHTGSDTMTALQKRSARRVVKMMFSLLIAFMVCTIPFQVSTMYENYKDRQITLPSWYDPVYFTAINLMYAHSAINPIIYGALNQTFRQGFKELIGRCRKGHRQRRWQSQMTILDNTRAARVAVVGAPQTAAVMEQDGGYINTTALGGSRGNIDTVLDGNCDSINKALVSRRDIMNTSALDGSRGNMNTPTLDGSRGNMNTPTLDGSRGNMNITALDGSRGNMNTPTLDGSRGNMNTPTLDGSCGIMNTPTLDGSCGNMNTPTLDGSHANLSTTAVDRSCCNMNTTIVEENNRNYNTAFNRSCIDTNVDVDVSRSEPKMTVEESHNHIKTALSEGHAYISTAADGSPGTRRAEDRTYIELRQAHNGNLPHDDVRGT